MTEQLRTRPLSKAEQTEIRGLYRAGDSFRDAKALAQRYNVSAEDISDVVRYCYSKGRKK